MTPTETPAQAAVRALSGATKRELGARLGVSTATVRAWHNGRRTPARANRRQLLRALHAHARDTLNAAEKLAETL